MVKKILLFLFLSSTAFGNSVQIIGGSLTYHVDDAPGVAQNYTNKISGDGELIGNPIYGIGLFKQNQKRYTSYSLFGGEDSVSGQIIGFTYSHGLRFHNFYIGYILGSYFQNNEDFEKRNIIPFSLFQIGQEGMVPIAGANLGYRIPISKEMYIMPNFILSPVICNATISLGIGD